MKRAIIGWEDSNRIEDGYRVYRTDVEGTDPSTLTPYATLPAGSTQFVDEAVEYGDVWYYTISAYNDVDEVFGNTVRIEIGKFLFSNAWDEDTVMRVCSPATGLNAANFLNHHGNGTNIMKMDTTPDGRMVSIEGYRPSPNSRSYASSNLYIASEDGSSIESVTFDGNIHDLTVHGNFAFVAVNNPGQIVKYDLDTKTEVWKRSVVGAYAYSISIVNNMVATMSRGTTSTNPRILEIYDIDTGKLLASSGMGTSLYEASAIIGFSPTELAHCTYTGINLFDFRNMQYREFKRKIVSTGGLRSSGSMCPVDSLVADGLGHVYYADNEANSSTQQATHIVKGKPNYDTDEIDIVWAIDLPFDTDEYVTDMIYDHDEHVLYFCNGLRLVKMDAETGSILWVNTDHIGTRNISTIHLLPGRSYYTNRKTIL